MKNKKLFIIVPIIACAISITSCKKTDTTTPATTTTTTTTTTTYTIGKHSGGGIVFYVDGTGQHGLIADTSNLTASAKWGIGNISMTTGTAIGTGQANTTAIVAAQANNSFAANVCDQLAVNGYSDWFLPSKDELNLLYLQKTVVGGFAPNAYWSSSAVSSTGAWMQDFNTGSQASYGVSTAALKFRAVRAF